MATFATVNPRSPSLSPRSHFVQQLDENFLARCELLADGLLRVQERRLEETTHIIHVTRYKAEDGCYRVVRECGGCKCAKRKTRDLGMARKYPPWLWFSISTIYIRVVDTITPRL